MQGRLLLNVVIRQGATVLKLFSSKDETLLVRRDALLVLDLGLHIVDGVGRLNLEGDSLAGHLMVEDRLASAISHPVQHELLPERTTHES